MAAVNSVHTTTFLHTASITSFAALQTGYAVERARDDHILRRLKGQSVKTTPFPLPQIRIKLFCSIQPESIIILQRML
ncbi:hypothetical protein A3206_04690 [Candidatus Methanomassiliicoccus intestinalis]|uniref:Uncharacterized protein n=1 Tax=Methanomassiliicoccus intestinalis (strain Issoire-Mx1) TaxID=1295009 RepID=R9T8K8_METII|nr:hypothetical protein MMINT_17445 [Candidatus Methanomassiliicoccus intestinalis Issoire-Mx1]TQS80989.1 MAG: hypothetical protein A3206_04690 [Candidatus Methanomassiliicoccus intestinalis]